MKKKLFTIIIITIIALTGCKNATKKVKFKFDNSPLKNQEGWVPISNNTIGHPYGIYAWIPSGDGGPVTPVFEYRGIVFGVDAGTEIKELECNPSGCTLRVEQKAASD